MTDNCLSENIGDVPGNSMNVTENEILVKWKLRILKQIESAIADRKRESTQIYLRWIESKYYYEETFIKKPCFFENISDVFINIPYFELKKKFWNEQRILLHFGGNNMGSSVNLYYTTSKKKKHLQKKEECFKNYKSDIENLISKYQKELINMKTGDSIRFHIDFLHTGEDQGYITRIIEENILSYDGEIIYKNIEDVSENPKDFCKNDFCMHVIKRLNQS